MTHTSGKRWRHVIINAHCTWLPGDPRGFRNRGHRIHSSGDYRVPPPAGEHVGLNRFHRERSAPPTRLPSNCLGIVGRAICDNLFKRSHLLAAVAVTPVHTHFLVELPGDVATIKSAVGWCKRFATREARKAFPELNAVELWAAGETYKPIVDDSHFQSALNYIATKQGADAWVWRNPQFDFIK